MKNDYVMYRLPYDEFYTVLRQEESELLRLESLSELNGKEGFVIAPFANSDEYPILLLRPDSVEKYDLEPFSNFKTVPVNLANDNYRQRYAADFSKFHERLETDEFKKLVLAHCVHVDASSDVSPEELFKRACRLYRSEYIALVSTSVSGTWLVATPEIILKKTEASWRTIGLAGTMRYSEVWDWTEKNETEQQYVADYLREKLKRISDNIKEKGPYTLYAGGLLHLRTDFDFTLEDTSRLGDILESLHPTPAVCGLPKEPARKFIIENESSPRKYYSGFMGMISPVSNTRLYVALRCMQITSDGYDLYAGGGLLHGSVEQQEWEETMAKFETMKRVIGSTPQPLP